MESKLVMNQDDKRILEDCDSEIEIIKKWIDNHKLDSNVKFLVSYAVIRASGSIEVVFKSMISTFLSQNCIKETKQYLAKNIVESSANPSPTMIKKFLEKFDSDRTKEFEDKLKGTQEKGDLTSLVNLRNNIAHGQPIPSTITEVESYYLSGKMVLQTLEQILKN